MGRSKVIGMDDLADVVHVIFFWIAVALRNEWRFMTYAS